MLIESIGYFLPTKEVSTDQVVKDCKNKVWIPLEKITGIKSRRMAGEHEYAIDFAKNAITQCLENSKYNVEDIDLLICCNISRLDEENKFAFEPSTSIRLLKYFNMINAIAFDVSNACAGVFTGLKTAQTYLDAGLAQRILVVSGEYITHLTKTAQKEIKGFRDNRMPCLTLGDSGVAVLVEASANPELGFQRINLFTYSEYSDYCIAKPTDQEHGGAIMYTEYNDLVEKTVPVCIEHSVNAVKEMGWNLEDFDHLIMHQISSQTIKAVKSKLNEMSGRELFNNNNTINNLTHRGNTSSTTHMVAIMDFILNGKIKSGEKILFSINASGITVGTAVYVLDDLPDRIRTKLSQQHLASIEELNS